MLDDVIYRTIGKRLRSRRLRLGLTQRDVAQACGLTFQQIQKYEVGQVALSVSRLLALAAVLDIPAAALIEDLGSGSSLSVITRQRQTWVEDIAPAA